MAPPVFKTELRGVTLRGWFDSIPSPPLLLVLASGLGHEFFRREDAAQVQQEGVLVNPPQDRRVRRAKTRGDFFAGEPSMADGDDPAGQLFLR